MTARATRNAFRFFLAVIVLYVILVVALLHAEQNSVNAQKQATRWYHARIHAHK